MVGGRVCWVHGGAAPQTRQAAVARQVEQEMRRAFQITYSRHRACWQEWNSRRVLITAHLLKMRPEDVGGADIVYCRLLHGIPRAEPEPQFRPVRRYGPRALTPPRGGPDA